jgi:hypothetical protein
MVPELEICEVVPCPDEQQQVSRIQELEGENQRLRELLLEFGVDNP